MRQSLPEGESVREEGKDLPGGGVAGGGTSYQEHEIHTCREREKHKSATPAINTLYVLFFRFNCLFAPDTIF